jgi:hypothetical protein
VSEAGAEGGGRGPQRRFRALGSTVLPAWSVRGLAGVLLGGAVGMPWLAQWQGVLARPQGEMVVEEVGRWCSCDRSWCGCRGGGS